MDIKRFNILVCFVSFTCAILAIAAYFLSDIISAISMWYFPIELLAFGLRWLSFSSFMGNVLAWIIYVGICLIPASFVIYKFIMYKRVNKLIYDKKLYDMSRWNSKENESLDDKNFKIKLTDIILLLLSTYLFFMIYCFINPGFMSFIIPDINMGDMEGSLLSMLKNVIVAVAYSLIIGFIVLKFADNFRIVKNKSVSILMHVERILIICTLIYVAFVCFTLPLNLFQEFTTTNNSDSAMFATLIKFLLELLPMACFVGIMESGVILLHSLKEDKYSEKTINSANILAERSRRTVSVSIICNIALNVIELLFWQKALNANVLLDIPFIPLILAFIGLLVAEYLKESSNLYNDNKMII